MTRDDLLPLPGGALLADGLDAISRGECTVPALLVAEAWPRLVPVGLLTQDAAAVIAVPGQDRHITAYLALAAEHGNNAHAVFKALEEELESALVAVERGHRLVREA